MTPVVPAARRAPLARDRMPHPVPAPSMTTVGHLLPNLLLAGVTHAGATALASALARHPEVKLPAVRRVDHYSPMRFGHPVQATLADYDRHFATWRGQRYRLERSPVYFDGGRELIERVARDLPGVRVLIVLRDPAERMWVSYQDKVSRGRLPRAMSYETYVEHCLTLRGNDADRFEGNRYFRTLSSGVYLDHLEGWLEAFGERVRVVFAENLDLPGSSTVDEVHTWLGLDPNARAPRGGSAVTSDAPEPAWLETFESDGGRRLWSSLAGSVELVRRVARIRLPRQSDRLRGGLERFYAGPNQRLAVRLREAGYRDLPAWLDAAA